MIILPGLAWCENCKKRVRTIVGVTARGKTWSECKECGEEL